VELKEVIKKRHSVRKYQDKSIPEDTIKEIIKLAKKAPSAGGLRGYEVIVTDKKMVAQVDAPLYLVICTDPERYAKRYGDRGKDLYSVQDATILGAYIQLLAVDYGLDTVWVGAFNNGKIKKLLNTDLLPVVIMPIGYKI